MQNVGGSLYEENNKLGCEKIANVCENSDDEDSFGNPELPSTDSSESDDLASIKDKSEKKYPTFNPCTSMELIEFQPCMIFTFREQLREAIRDYGVAQ